MEILALLVTYNSEKWIRKNLASIGSEADILVLDNGSKDNTVTIIRQEFPNVRLIENEDNLGFAAANNIGFEIATKENYDWVFLVNHDGWLAEGCIAEMIKVMQNPDYKEYGILSPVHFAGDEKSYDFGFVRFCDVNKLENYQNKKIDVLDVHEVNGAFMMISKECLQKINGFDPIFFFYGEDVDLCFRAKKYDFKIGVVTKAIAYHDRKYREPDENRLANLVLSNYLVQFKQIRGGFWNSYIKTMYSCIINKNTLKEMKFKKVFNFFVHNIESLKFSYNNYN